MTGDLAIRKAVTLQVRDSHDPGQPLSHLFPTPPALFQRAPTPRPRYHQPGATMAAHGQIQANCSPSTATPGSPRPETKDDTRSYPLSYQCVGKKLRNEPNSGQPSDLQDHRHDQRVPRRENGDWLQRPKRSLRVDAAACPPIFVRQRSDLQNHGHNQRVPRRVFLEKPLQIRPDLLLDHAPVGALLGGGQRASRRISGESSTIDMETYTFWRY